MVGINYAWFMHSLYTTGSNYACEALIRYLENFVLIPVDDVEPLLSGIPMWQLVEGVMRPDGDRALVEIVQERKPGR